MRTYLEKEIESDFIDWSIRYSADSRENARRSHSWKYLGRQVRLPYGVCDVLLFNVFGRFGFDIVEVKRDTATDRTVAQVLSYVAQFDEMLFRLCQGPNGEHWYHKNSHFGNSKPIIVAPKLEGDFIKRCHVVGVFTFIQVIQKGDELLFKICDPGEEKEHERYFMGDDDEFQKILSSIPEIVSEIQYTAWKDMSK